MEIVSHKSASLCFDARLKTLSRSESAYDARIGRMLIDLVQALRREVSGPRLMGSAVLQQLMLTYLAPAGAAACITVEVDRPDYGPLDNGIPLFHYRMTYRLRLSDRRTDFPRVEERTRSIKTGCEFVLEAIREARRLP